MKKLFVVGAAIAALAMFSCSKENSEPGARDKDGNLMPAGTSFASFSFNIPTSGGKAPVEFEPQAITADDIADSKIDFTDLYMLVFDMSGTNGILEYAAPVTQNPLTKLLRAGNKKIFVLANIGAPSASANVQANLKSVNTSTLAPSATLAPFSSLVEGSTTYAEFLQIAFDAGTPQIYSVDKTGTRTYDLRPLSNRLSATLGLPMSNSNASTFVLMANISETDASNAGNGTPVANGSQAYNRFVINLDYMGAKARLAMDQSAASFVGKTTADITLPVYSIKNLAKYTSLVQNVAGSTPQSIYHSLLPFVDGVDIPQSEFDKHFDQASTETIAVPAAPAGFIFVPENTSSSLRRGQSSFYALNVTYKPKFIVTEASWDVLALNANKVTAVTKTYDAATVGGVANPGGLDGGNKYIYDQTGVTDKNNVTCNFFANLRVYADMVWMTTYNMPMTDPSYSQAAAYALVGNDPGTGFVFIDPKVRIFTDAQSWYRIDIGETINATTTKYGVLRSNAYTATINDISGPGLPTEGELFTGIGDDDNPEDPLDALTFVDVTIVPAIWHPIYQITTLK